MIDHIILQVSDLDRSGAFYRGALAPLGYEVATDYEGFLGFGRDNLVDFWLAKGAATAPVHVAFRAESRSAVDAFHAAALAAGGRDHGAPGLRTHYHPDYYGAFVLDPDGHNIEAVSRTRE